MIAELAIKELLLSITLLEQCVKHFEKLKILVTVSEMRSRDRPGEGTNVRPRLTVTIIGQS